MPHYKDHRLAGEDHEDVFLVDTVDQGDALVFIPIHVADLEYGAHVPGIDPNLTELDLDEEMMPVDFLYATTDPYVPGDPFIRAGVWIPGPATSQGGTGSRAFGYFMGS